MTRRVRRTAKRTTTDVLNEMLGKPQRNTDACPDCRADLTLEKDASGIYVMVIAHDLTCPWMTARERSAL